MQQLHTVPTPLGDTANELVRLLRRRRELELRLRFTRGQGQRLIRRKLARASRRIRAWFR